MAYDVGVLVRMGVAPIRFDFRMVRGAHGRFRSNVGCDAANRSTMQARLPVRQKGTSDGVRSEDMVASRVETTPVENRQLVALPLGARYRDSRLISAHP